MKVCPEEIWERRLLLKLRDQKTRIVQEQQGNAWRRHEDDFRVSELGG